MPPLDDSSSSTNSAWISPPPTSQAISNDRTVPEMEFVYSRRAKHISNLEHYQKSERMKGTETTNSSPSGHDLNLPIEIRMVLDNAPNILLLILLPLTNFLQSMHPLSRTLAVLLFLSLFMKH